MYYGVAGGLSAVAVVMYAVAQKRRGDVYPAQLKAERKGLRGGRDYHWNAGGGAKVAVARRVNKVRTLKRLGSVFVFKVNGANTAALADSAGDIRVGVDIHPGFKHHALGFELAVFGIHRNMTFWHFHLRRSVGNKSFDIFPGDAAHYTFAVFEKSAYRNHKARSLRAAEKTKALNKGCAPSASCRRSGGYPSGGTSAANHNVIFADYGNAFGYIYTIHCL